MAIAKFCKLDLVVHESVRDDVIRDLQKFGCCEIIKVQPSGEDVQELGDLKHLEDKLSEARFAIRFLEPYYEYEGDKIARLLGNKPKVSLNEMAELDSNFDIHKYSAKLRDIERKLSEIRAELSRLKTLEEILIKIKDFPLPLSLLTRGTQYVSGVVAVVPVEQIGVIRTHLEESIKPQEGEFYITKPAEKDKEVYAMATFLKNKEEEIRNIFIANGASIVELDRRLTETPLEELAKIANSREDLNIQEKKLCDLAAEEARSNFAKVQLLHDYYDLIKKKSEALSSGLSTDHATWMQMWVPRVTVDLIKEAMSSYGKLVDMEFTEPGEEDKPPVFLVSKKWALPFEPLTKLYGLPEYDAIDPTPFFAPFYFVFFGMCLGDGGYGIVLASLLLYAILKYHPRRDTLKFFTLLFLGGIATIFVGLLTGSWFGDMIDSFPIFEAIRDIKNSVKITDVMYDPMPFLGLSLFLGFVQIIFGLFIAFFDNLRRKDYIGAIGDQGGWITFLLGLASYILVRSGMLSSSFSTPSLILTCIGAGILVATQGREKKHIISKLLSGILSLYSVTSYLGDVLSYSRLLALGLATSAIAMIINTLTLQLFHIPYLGWLMGLILFTVGHSFSLAVNVLGAFVHSLRLQYVEFFSKFYKAGGKPFSPFNMDARYVQVAEAHDYETLIRSKVFG